MASRRLSICFIRARTAGGTLTGSGGTGGTVGGTVVRSCMVIFGGGMAEVVRALMGGTLDAPLRFARCSLACAAFSSFVRVFIAFILPLAIQYASFIRLSRGFF